MKYIECEQLLSDWFNNTWLNLDNETVLLITSSLMHYPEKMKELFRKNPTPVSCYIDTINSLKNYMPDFKNFRSNVRLSQNIRNEETDSSAKNLVFFVDKLSVEKIKLLLNVCRKNNKKILFAVVNDVFLIFEDRLKNGHIEAKVLPEYAYCYLDVFLSNPIKLVMDDIYKEQIAEIIAYRIRFIQGLLKDVIYLDEDIRNKIDQDIKLLKHTKLLTSNLALHLYNLTFFKFNYNGTESGRYFRDELGIHSKTFTANSKKLKTIQYKPSKPFKAYDLSINMEKQIRLDIASKIVQHIKSDPSQALDSQSIAFMTNLSVEEVGEIFESYQRTKKSFIERK